MDVIPARGERMLIAGQTGSGKTTFATWLLERLENYPRIIIDTKIEPKFAAMPQSVVLDDWKEAVKISRKKAPPRHIVLRPSIEVASDWESMDALLMSHYREMRGLPIYIDEVYQVHSGGRAGPGLIGLLTRGRSRGITTIMSTQRPLWLSRYALTEAQRFAIFRLIDRQDRKRIGEVTPYPSDAVLPRYYWAYWDGELEGFRLFAPIPYEGGAGYVDETPSRVERWF